MTCWNQSQIHHRNQFKQRNPSSKMQSLFMDCCYPVPQEQTISVENLREFVDYRYDEAMNIDPPPPPPGSPPRRRISPQQTDFYFESPPRAHRSDLKCPNAPRKQPRDAAHHGDQIYPATSVATSVPLFPFDGFDRVNSEDSTLPSPRALFDLEPKFTEPSLVEEYKNLDRPDEEREPVEEDNCDRDSRQSHESDQRSS